VNKKKRIEPHFVLAMSGAKMHKHPWKVAVREFAGFHGRRSHSGAAVGTGRERGQIAFVAGRSSFSDPAGPPRLSEKRGKKGVSEVEVGNSPTEDEPGTNMALQMRRSCPGAMVEGTWPVA
jgi:hypothetical protein